MNGRNFLDIYDEDYCERFLERANSPLGRAIYAARWKMIWAHVRKGTLLDYGSGPGVFNKCGPKQFLKCNYDINPYSGFSAPVDRKFHIMTMWDSIEHIPNFYNIIKKYDPTWLFLSTPNLESVQGPITEWKHYRPEEHVFYFDRHSLRVILSDMGYEIIECLFEEGKLRDQNNPSAIISIVARRIK